MGRYWPDADAQAGGVSDMSGQSRCTRRCAPGHCGCTYDPRAGTEETAPKPNPKIISPIRRDSLP
jgi:hypothetical protein